MITADLTKFQMGIETSTAISWDNTMETTYTNVSGSAWYIACVLGVVSGSSMPYIARQYASSH